jgi:formylglycine-generating enzyme required for sulfatase activity
MGDAGGDLDERPPAVVTIDRPFWIGACEVTNEQLRRFDDGHNSGYFMQRYPGMNGPGLSLNGAGQPAVRVSWRQAMGFCRWLSERTGTTVSLPTEAEWEYACRAGTATPLAYGPTRADFSAWANMADRTLAMPPSVTGGLGTSLTGHVKQGQKPNIRGILLEAVSGGNFRCDARFDDGCVATAPVGQYRANAWGLHDMHGNAAEWTRSAYRPSPCAEDGDDGGRHDGGWERKVVRGGSWIDRPSRCRSAFRLDYPEWQRVHNVGFRVVCYDDGVRTASR